MLQRNMKGKNMEIIKNIIKWLKVKINARFEDHDNIRRFFRAEYGQDAEIAYYLWQTKRELYTKYR